MRVFTAVAERSGFSAAAEALDRSTASVTRQVAALEQRLGTRLLNRTTRRVSLTSAGTPKHPSDLAGHECLLYHYSPNGDEVRFHGPDGELAVRIHGGLRANNGHVLNAAALAGQGIVIQPDFLADAHLASGRLQRILPEYDLDGVGIFAVYASRNHLAPKVRSFIDYLIDCLADPAPG